MNIVQQRDKEMVKKCIISPMRKGQYSMIMFRKVFLLNSGLKGRMPLVLEFG